MSILERNILKYETANGKIPFDEWFNKLKDKKTKAVVDARLLRLRLGNLGQYRDLGDGVKELKIQLGPGFRVYFSELNGSLVLLLVGGDKGSQSGDIKSARSYLNDFRRRQNG